jgi:hypothetical protein
MRLYYPILLGRWPDTENTRPTYVVDALTKLTARPTGKVKLPVVMDWTPANIYDVTDSYQRQRLYEPVLAEVHCEDDIKRYINGEELTRLWDKLHIPSRVRYA